MTTKSRIAAEEGLIKLIREKLSRTTDMQKRERYCKRIAAAKVRIAALKLGDIR